LELIDLAWMEMLTERIRCTSLGQRLFNLHVMLIFVMFLTFQGLYNNNVSNACMHGVAHSEKECLFAVWLTVV